MMRTQQTKNFEVGRALAMKTLFHESTIRELRFEARIWGEPWFFQFSLERGWSNVDGFELFFPWLRVRAEKGEKIFLTGESPFDDGTEAKFEWDPDVDPAELTRLFVEELEKHEDRESEFCVTAALEEAIRQWGGKVAFELRDV